MVTAKPPFYFQIQKKALKPYLSPFPSPSNITSPQKNLSVSNMSIHLCMSETNFPLTNGIIGDR